MKDTTQGQTWPLNVVFVVTLIGGVIGIVAWTLRPANFNIGVAVILGILALVTCVLLYVPRLYLMSKVPTIDAIVQQVSRIEMTAHAVQPQLAQMQNSLAELTKRLDVVTTTLKALGPIQAGVSGLTDQVNTGGVRTSLNGIKTAVTALGDVQARLTAIAGQLAAIDGKLKPPT